MVPNSQEYRLQYWATRVSVRSFARTGLLALLAPSAALTRSLACSLCSLSRSWDSKWLDGYFVCVFFLLSSIVNKAEVEEEEEEEEEREEKEEEAEKEEVVAK